MLVCLGCRVEVPPERSACPTCGQAASATVAAPPVDAPAQVQAAEQKRATFLNLFIPELETGANPAWPDQTRRTIAGDLHGVVDECIHQFGGCVQLVEPHRVVVLFGAPLAHEHYVQFACYAALQLRDEVQRYTEYLWREQGLRLSPRLALDIDQVTTATMTWGAPSYVTVPAEAVERLDALAHFTLPHHILVTEAVTRRVDDFFHFDGAGRLRAAGMAHWEPVSDLATVAQHLTRFDVARARGLSPLVGREADLAVLESALDRALAGQGHLLTVSAQPGVGKSRLVHEFAARCRQQGIQVYETRGVPVGQGLPFMPLLQLAFAYFGILPEDTPAQMQDKILRQLSRLSLSLTKDLPILATFLGAPDPDQPAATLLTAGAEQPLFEALNRVLKVQSEAAPTLIVLEDIHTWDSASLAALVYAIPHMAQTRCLMVATHRAEYQPTWDDTFAWTPIELDALPQADADTLVRALLGDDASLRSLIPRLLDGTGGNPFFIEEMVRALAQSGALVGRPGAYRLIPTAPPIDVPATIHAVIAARIDRLPPGEKQLLQTAAVLGREFRQDVLHRILGWSFAELNRALWELADAGFLTVTDYFPDVTWEFHHALTHEVAGKVPVPDRRREIHHAAARALADAHADHADAQAAIIAAHFRAGGRPLDAARWHARAARHVGIGNPVSALVQWRKVRDLLTDQLETAEVVALRLETATWLLQYGWRLGLPLREADGIFAESQALATRHGGADVLALLTASYAIAYCVVGRPHLLPLCEEARERAAAATNPGLRVAVDLCMAIGYFTAGRLPEGLRLLDTLLADTAVPVEVGAEYFGYPPRVCCRLMRAMIWMYQGRVQEARAELATGVRAAEAYPAVELRVWMHGAAAALERLTGNAEAARTHAHRAMHLSEQVDVPYVRYAALRGLGHAHAAAGAWAPAADAFEAAMQLTRERGAAPAWAPETLCSVAVVRLIQGDGAAALAAVEEAITLARQHANPLFECEALQVRALALLFTRGVAVADEVRGMLATVEDLTVRTSARLFLPGMHIARAVLAQFEQDDTAAEQEIADMRALLRDMGAPGLVPNLTL